MASRAKSRTLTDHEEIRRWAEERNVRPSTVRRTHTDDDTGIIRLDFPRYSGGDALEEISWDEWFEDFEDRNLALIVQDETSDGEQSNFNKLVSRDTVENHSAETGWSRRRRATSSRKSSKTSQSETARKTRRGLSASASSRSGSSKSRSNEKRKTAERNRSSGRKAA